MLGIFADVRERELPVHSLCGNWGIEFYSGVVRGKEFELTTFRETHISLSLSLSLSFKLVKSLIRRNYKACTCTLAFVSRFSFFEILSVSSRSRRF